MLCRINFTIANVFIDCLRLRGAVLDMIVFFFRVTGSVASATSAQPCESM